MKNTLLQAMNNCALKHTKGINRSRYLWQDMKSMEQQAEDMDKELRAMGYRLLKLKEINTGDEFFITTMEGE